MMGYSVARQCLAGLVFLFWATIGAAQSAAPDYEQWQSVAERAEMAVETAAASDAAFNVVRSEIAGWREQFQAQFSVNDSRILTLREQIAALGPVPEDPTTEADEIVARRAELNAQIQRLTTPQRTAEEAFSRANGIIAEIDRIIRDRQADELLNAGPWPVNPAFWPGALRNLRDTVTAFGAGTRQAWGNPTRRSEAQSNLPLTILLVVVGVLLVTRARSWSEWLAVRIQLRDSRATADVAAFIVSLGQIVAPMIGVIALVRAITVTDMFGPRGRVLLESLETVGLLLFFALWLASRTFPGDDAVRGATLLPSKRRTEARVYIFFLALVYAASFLLSEFSTFDRYTPATDAVLNYPLVILASLMLIRVGWILRRVKTKSDDEAAPEQFVTRRAIALFGRGVMIVGVVAPLLATFGYGTAAKFLVFPTILTLGLFGTVRLLQTFVRDVYAAFKQDEEAKDKLFPTLASFAIVVLAIGVLPLIWGARVTDMTEIFSQVRTGVKIGDVTITPGSFFTLFLVFGLGYGITRAVQNALKVSVLPKTKIEPGGQVAIVSGLGYVGIFLAGLIAITAAGIDMSSFAIVAGALSVGIGFGLQTIVSNFVSGIILLIERPIAEGDWIEVGGQMGYVRSISVRSTRIETFDRTDVIVPNADLISGTVTNYTRGNTVGRVIIPVGVAYGTDTRRVDRILRELAEAHPMALMNPPPMILFAGFGADSMDFEIRMILRDVNWMMVVKNELNHQIAARFAEEGIEIPFAQRDVWLRNPEALQTRAPAHPPQAAPETPDSTVMPDVVIDPDTDGVTR
jgi:potassium efflux system protein